MIVQTQYNETVPFERVVFYANGRQIRYKPIDDSVTSDLHSVLAIVCKSEEQAIKGIDKITDAYAEGIKVVKL